MRETVAITAGDLRAEVVPSVGGGLARFDLIAGGSSVPLFRPWPAEGTDDPNRLACYLLVPWSNRISGGGFRFGGQFHPLEANFPGEPCPLHGNGWTSDWAVAERTENTVSLVLASDGPEPFRYDAELVYQLEPGELAMHLQVTNRATLALPYGLGFHPWLPRTEGTRLSAPAASVWLEDPRHLPAGEAPVVLHEDWDFSLPQPLPEDWINNGFVGWNGCATIEWPEHGLALDVEAGAGLSTYLLYSPGRDADFFCFEPVSHPVDAHHLPGGPAANGLRILAPGERFEVTCAFIPRFTHRHPGPRGA
jgi:aldose 1-epimerase